MKSIITIVIAAAVVVVLVVAGVNFFSSNKPAAQTPTPTPTSTVKPTPTATTPAVTPPTSPSATSTPTSLDQNVANLQQAINSVATTGKSQQLTITITESEANAQAAKMLAQMTFPPEIPAEIKALNIDFKPNNIVTVKIDAATRGIVFNMTVTAQLQLSVQAGKPSVKVTDINYSIPFLPQSVKDQVNALITQNLDPLIAQLFPTTVSGSNVIMEYTAITTQETSVSVNVIVKPK